MLVLIKQVYEKGDPGSMPTKKHCITVAAMVDDQFSLGLNKLQKLTSVKSSEVH